MSKRYDVVIVGGGIIGTATARELSKYNLSVLLLEKNNHLGGETTEGNSGVIHVGFDAVPGTLKAKYNIEGRQLWFKEVFPHMEFRRAQVPSLVIAMKSHSSNQLEALGSYENLKAKSELDHIKLLYKRGITNKLDKSEMKVLNREQTMKIEPNITPLVEGALFAPKSWAISGPEVTYAFMANAIDNGAELRVKQEVVDIVDKKDHFWIKVAGGCEIEATVVIDAAGHYADTIAHLANVETSETFKQTTRRGEYRVLAKTESSFINNIIFKTPTIFGKGVVVAPTLTGHVLVGPTALNGVPKQDTRLVTPEQYSHIGDIGNDMVPSLRLHKTEKTFAGSRPIDIASNDFVIRASKKSKQFIILGGMQSPALASAPAIAKRASTLVKQAGLKLTKKADFNPKYKTPIPATV